MKLELKKEECYGEGGKGVPMDTSTAAPSSEVKTEDRKPEVKKEVKEEEETSEAAAPQAPVKKKSKTLISFSLFFSNSLPLLFKCLLSHPLHMLTS